MTDCMSIYSPELLWHGGADNGKPEPVFAVDMHPSNVLATAGNDENIPPKGSVRLWKVDMQKDGQEFVIEFSDHQSVVNTVRFSPCGKMIASASDKQIVIYKVANADDWQTLTDVRNVERIWLRPSLDEIFDLKWSPDSNFIIAGALDNKAEILRVATRDSVIINGHTNYVQGVAWDPLNAMVVTQSADRTCKMHQLKLHRPGTMVKLAARGHVVAKMCQNQSDEKDKDEPLTAADFGIASAGEAPLPASKKQQNLFADYTVQSYFRRPDFTPDGTLLIAPTGIHRPTQQALPVLAKPQSTDNSASFCTHIFWRDHLQAPIVSLTGLEDPSVAVRCCPILYKLVKSDGEQVPDIMVAGKYRVVFAVVTLTAVYIYDTQHPYPLARVGGLHFACINDATWSSDGRMLTVCSSDGYLTFIKFNEGALGEVLEIESVPEVVKATFPCVYFKMYGIVPAPPEVAEKKEKAAVAVPAATISHPEVQKTEQESAAEEQVGENDPSLLSPTSTQAIQASMGSETKKRKITPTNLGAVGAANGYGNLVAIDTAASVEQDPQQILNMVSSHVQAASPSVAAVAAADKDKKKRRITPILVTSNLPVEMATQPADAFTAAHPCGVSGSSGSVEVSVTNKENSLSVANDAAQVMGE